MRCKRFTIAKRDLLLTKLQNIDLYFNHSSLNERDIEFLRDQIDSCIVILKQGLSD